MLKKSVITISIAALLLQAAPAFADQRGRQDSRRDFRQEVRRDYHRDYHRDYRREVIVRRLPARYIAYLIGGLTYLYCEGLFYRSIPGGYVVVPQPMGVIAPVMQPNYAPVMMQEPYYGYTY